MQKRIFASHFTNNIRFCKQNVSSKNMALRATAVDHGAEGTIDLRSMLLSENCAVGIMIILFLKHYIIVAGRAFFIQLCATLCFVKRNVFYLEKIKNHQSKINWSILLNILQSKMYAKCTHQIKCKCKGKVTRSRFFYGKLRLIKSNF